MYKNRVESLDSNSAEWRRLDANYAFQEYMKLRKITVLSKAYPLTKIYYLLIEFE